MEYNNIPGIEIDTSNNFNPVIQSPNSHYNISFYLTREDTIDVETYKRFLENAISRFRKSVPYRQYKRYLIEDIGLNRCQFHSNITTDMEDVTIEMHHAILTIFDIALMLCEYTLQTRGYISTFDLVMLLEQEHINNRVAVVMMSLTPHQLHHNMEGTFIHPDMCFGNWWEFLDRYMIGMTPEVAVKLSYYFDKAIELGVSTDGELLRLRNSILDWSKYN
ncbi:MAG: hypothetical protein ACRCXT_08290 [Paraclostridium sp.]